MIKLKINELHEKDSIEIGFCNGGFKVEENKIECSMIIQEIYNLYKNIEKLKAFKSYNSRMIELTDK